MGHLVVVLAFVVLAQLVVCVDQARVVVLVLVIVGPVLELAERAARVVMRDVVVVVGVDRRGMSVLVLHVADDTLRGACLQDAPPQRATSRGHRPLDEGSDEVVIVLQGRNCPRLQEARPAFKSLSPSTHPGTMP
jgi:hypothetical protein